MQIWVYFVGGYGGDGLINLLERSPSVTPLDGLPLYLHDGTPNWRHHRYVDNVPKFWAPSIYVNDTDRTQHGCSDDNQFTNEYINAVEKNLTIITGSHDTTLSDFKTGNGYELYSKNRISVLILPNLVTVEEVFIRYKKAHLLEIKTNVLDTVQFQKFKQHVELTIQNQHQFDFVIDNIKDNNQLTKLYKNLNLTYSDSTLSEWHEISNGKLYFDVPKYKSYVENNQYKYVEN